MSHSHNNRIYRESRPTPVCLPPAPAPLPPQAVPAPDGERRAEVFLPAQEGSSSDGVLEICLNGKNTILRRGVKVEVPLCLAEIIEHAGLYAVIRKL